MSDQIPQFIRDLMPDADEAAHLAALENVRAYLRVVDRIHARLTREAMARFDKSPESSQNPS